MESVKLAVLMLPVHVWGSNTTSHMDSEPPTNRGDVSTQAHCGLVPKEQVVRCTSSFKLSETGWRQS